MKSSQHYTALNSECAALIRELLIQFPGLIDEKTPIDKEDLVFILVDLIKTCPEVRDAYKTRDWGK